MAEIVPFRGCRYDPTVAGEIGKLIAPPYDVIDSELRDTLFRLSEYNIAHIIRADRQEGDPSANPYASAAALCKDWRARGVIMRDEQLAIYVYEQFFEISEQKFSRTGFIVLVRLQNLGTGVLPHESTLVGPRMDRLDLVRATRMQFGQVFGLYPDPERRVDGILEQAKAKRPLIQAADPGNLHHRIWPLTDPETIAEVQDAMRDKQILIADGHHRYETSLAYSQEHPDCEAARFRMMTLVNISNPGLIILPIHRLVKGLSDFDPEAFLTALKKNFQVLPYPGQSQAVRTAVTEAIRTHQAEGRHAFGLFLGTGNYYVIILERNDLMACVEGHSEAWCRLDVTILQHLILDKLLGITRERLENQTNVEYVQDFPHAIKNAADRVASGDGQALFLLNATRVKDVLEVAENRERMPQKSTFFFPKVYTGLVFYDME